MLLMKFTFKKGTKLFVITNTQEITQWFSPFSVWRETLQKLIFQQTFYFHLDSCIKVFFLYNNNGKAHNGNSREKFLTPQ